MITIVPERCIQIIFLMDINAKFREYFNFLFLCFRIGELPDIYDRYPIGREVYMEQTAELA